MPLIFLISCKLSNKQAFFLASEKSSLNKKLLSGDKPGIALVEEVHTFCLMSHEAQFEKLICPNVSLFGALLPLMHPSLDCFVYFAKL